MPDARPPDSSTPARRLRRRAARGRARRRLRRRADLLRGGGHAGPDRPGRPLLGRAHTLVTRRDADPRVRPGVPPVLPRRAGDAAPSTLTARRSARRRRPSRCSRSRRPSRGEARRRRGGRARADGLRRRGAPADKSFAACTPEELAALRRIMARHPARPRRAAAPGARRRRAAAAGPTCAGPCGRRCACTASPAELFWRRRRSRLRPLVLILDVSGLDGRLLAQPAAVRALGSTPGRRPGRGVLLRHPADPDHPRRSSAGVPTTRSTGAAQAVVRLGGRHPDRRLARRVRPRLGAARAEPRRRSW